MLLRTLLALGLTSACFTVATPAFAAPEKPAGKKAPPASSSTTAAPAQPAPAAPGQPAAPAPGAPAQPGAPAPRGEVGPSYSTRLKLVQNRVNDLKEKVHRSKLRIEAIKELVLRGVVAGARATIIHKNDVGSRFKLVRVVYAIDGNVIYNKSDEALADKEEFEVFNGGIVPGNHNLSVTLTYRGNGFGPFTYLNQYRFTSKTSCPIAADEGKVVRMRVIGFEKSNVSTKMEDALTIQCKLNVQTDRAGAAPRSNKR